VTPLLALLIVMVTTRLLPLGVLALQLRWRGRYESRRQDTLVTLASRLPPKAVVESSDVRGDGRHLRLRIDAMSDQRAVRDA
jgi:hypothetical protein